MGVLRKLFGPGGSFEPLSFLFLVIVAMAPGGLVGWFYHGPTSFFGTILAGYPVVLLKSGIDYMMSAVEGNLVVSMLKIFVGLPLVFIIGILYMCTFGLFGFLILAIDLISVSLLKSLFPNLPEDTVMGIGRAISDGVAGIILIIVIFEVVNSWLNKRRKLSLRDSS